MTAVSGDVAELLSREAGDIVEDMGAFLFNEPLELDPFEQRLAQLRGTCLMLEFGSAATLLTELARTVQHLAGKGESVASHQADLALVLDVFPTLFQALPGISRDIPFLFLPELALLRRLQGLPPLYEFQLLSGHDWPQAAHYQGETELDADKTAALGKLKQIYQLGLLDILRDTNRRKGADMLAKVAAKLGEVLTSEAEQQYWALVGGVARALARGALAFNPVRLRLLAAVERQIKALLDNDPGKSPYPLGLWRAYAILLAMVDDRDDSDRQACEWAGAPVLDFVDSDIEAVRGLLFGDQGQALADFIQALEDRLGALHGFIERADGDTEFAADERVAIRQQLASLAVLCEERGLSQAATRLHCHADAVGEDEAAWAPDARLLKDTAHTILYLECLVQQVRDRGITTAGLLDKLDRQEVNTVVEQNLIATGRNAVWEECMRQLGTAKELVDDVSAEVVGQEIRGVLAGTFGAIEGAALVVGNDQVKTIAARCRHFVDSRLFDGEREQLAAFAEAVMALEYFFSNTVKGIPSDFVLAIAEDYLHDLEAA